jgi:hypothetical protein
MRPNGRIRLMDRLTPVSRRADGIREQRLHVRCEDAAWVGRLVTADARPGPEESVLRQRAGMSPDTDVIERLVWPLIECIAPLVGAELVLTGG